MRSINQIPTATREVIGRATWVDDRTATGAFEPSGSTDGIQVPQAINNLVYFSCIVKGSGTLTVHPKVWGWDGADWVEIEDFGTLSENGTDEIKYVFISQGIAGFERVSTGIVGAPGGTITSFLTRFGFLEG